MSKRNCDACSNLLTDNVEFATNGTTETVQASLKNNTGFNPNLKSLHDDCEDLNDANDCLIGNMTDEIDAYDVCDLKSYLKKFVGNLYEVLKAIIAAICGLWDEVGEIWNDISKIWTEINKLIKKGDNNCEMINALANAMRGGMAGVNADWINSKLSFASTNTCQILFGENTYTGCDGASHTTLAWTFNVEANGTKATSAIATWDILATWSDEHAKSAMGEKVFNTLKGILTTSSYSNIGFWIGNTTLVGCVLGHKDGKFQLQVEAINGTSTTGGFQYIHVPRMYTDM